QPTSARTLLGLGFIVLLTGCVVLVAWRRPATRWQWLRHPAALAAALLVFPLVFMPTLIALMMISIGGVATALAGNPPINGADEDVIIAIPAIATGLVLGWLLVRGEPGRPRTISRVDDRDETGDGEGP